MTRHESFIIALVAALGVSASAAAQDVAAVGPGAAAPSERSAPAPAASTSEDAIAETAYRTVKLMTLAAASSAGERRFFGQVAARQTVDLSFQVPGEIISMPVMEGDRVARGDVLAALDLSAYERAVERAALNLAQAERARDRAAQLAERRTGPRAEAEDAQTAVELAAVQLREARDQLEDATLRAPFDGLVAARLVDAFTTVAGGAPVLRLHDMSEVRVEFDVPERLFVSAPSRASMTFRVESDAAGVDTVGVLREFRAEASAVGQTYTVSVAIPQEDAAALLPGASATVTVSAANVGAGGMIAPPSAVVIAPDRSTYVLRYRPSADASDIGVLERVAVTVEARNGSRMAITSGVEPGDRIVSAGAHLLADGAVVRPFAGFGSLR